MKFKKILFTILAFGTLTIILTACDNKKTPEVTPSNQTNVVSQVTPAPISENTEASDNTKISEDIEASENSEAIENSIESDETLEESFVGMANPIVEYDTVEDAVISVGHLCNLPTIYARYNQKASVIANTLIQIDYSDDMGEILTLREQAGNSTDISGNYNTYAYTSTFTSNGNAVTIKGDSEDSINLVLWNDGAFAHSLDYVNGVSLDEVKQAVSEII